MRLCAVCLLLCAGLFSLPAVAADGEGDIWVGRYRMSATEKGGPVSADKVPVFSITRAPDADPTKPSKSDNGRTPIQMARALEPDPNKPDDKLQIDLTRWRLAFSKESDPTGDYEKDVSELRRLLPGEYKDAALDAMYAAGTIVCLEGDFVICHVQPGTTVIFSKGSDRQEFLASTGFFGWMIHLGLFEWTKLDATP